MNADTQQRILDAVDAGFEAQLATTSDFVAIPSTRGAEGPCQDMIGDLLRQRGYEVDDWHIDVNYLKDLRGFGPIEHDFSKARTVVGTYRPPTNAGRSLILQGHCDVVPAGPMLATIHNLHYYLDLMRGLRQAIAAGRLVDFVAEFYAQLEQGAPVEVD